jgi:hypothetical protein
VPAFGRFLDIGETNTAFATSTTTDSGSCDSSITFPKWRSISLQAEDKMAYSPPPNDNVAEIRAGSVLPLKLTDAIITTSFLSVTDDPENSEKETFLEHSYLVFSQAVSGVAPFHHHPATPGASQAANTAASETQDSTEISFLSATSLESRNDTSRQVLHLPPLLPGLKSLPNADHVLRLAPQTITLHLVVGVISITPPRTVQLRRSPRTMDIVEMLVGDETSAGFSVTFWLPSEPTGGGASLKPRRFADDGKDPSKGRLGSVLERVGPRDVLLMRNVALSVFQGRVHGQSLNARVCLNETTIECLGRVEGVDVEMDGDERRLQKVQRVRDWVTHFLGSARGIGRATGGEKGDAFTFTDQLPPDTMPDEE